MRKVSDFISVLTFFDTFFEEIFSYHISEIKISWRKGVRFGTKNLHVTGR